MAWKITVQAERKKIGVPRDRFLLVDGLKVARRGYHGTPQAGTWVSIEPGWEAKDVKGGDEIWVRYTNPTTGEVTTFPEWGQTMSAGVVYVYARVPTDGQTLDARMAGRQTAAALERFKYEG